jgi:pilus assembly protein Flp/PilA
MFRISCKGGDNRHLLKKTGKELFCAVNQGDVQHQKRRREKMLKKFRAMVKDEKGQALAEYGLILALIAVVCIAVLTTLGVNLRTILNQIATAV